MEEEDKKEIDQVLEDFKDNIANGTEYHKIIAQFCTEHHEIAQIVKDEMPYLVYDILKVASHSETLAMVLALDKPLAEELKMSISAAFAQGYYRCYQKMILEKMEKK